jgi:hypothetical protein
MRTSRLVDEELLQRGPEEARIAAPRSFGSIEAMCELQRNARSISLARTSRTA